MEEMTMFFDEEPISKLTKLPSVMKILFYDSVESLVKESWGGEDIKGSTFGYMDDKNNETCISVDELCKNIEDQGLWGFVDRLGTIHMWIDKQIAQTENLLSFFSHELGHLQRPFKRNDLKEEMKAERYSDISKFAYQLSKAVIK